MKLNEVQCPSRLPDEEGTPCGSYEITFERPLYKDRENEEVVIYGTCDSCGARIEVHGRVEAITVKVEKGV